MAGRALLQCDPWFPCTDQWVMKPPGAGHWPSMPGHVPRQDSLCRAGGRSSGNAVGVAWWWAGRGVDEFCPGAVGGIVRPQLNFLPCSEPPSPKL